MLWQGKPLEEYTKEELMVIIETLARMAEQRARRHAQDMAVLFSQED